MCELSQRSKKELNRIRHLTPMYVWMIILLTLLSCMLVPAGRHTWPGAVSLKAAPYI